VSGQLHALATLGFGRGVYNPSPKRNNMLRNVTEGLSVFEKKMLRIILGSNKEEEDVASFKTKRFIICRLLFTL
jgi:hypothetical protein